ncbi:MFS transporter [Pseudomonas putida]
MPVTQKRSILTLLLAMVLLGVFPLDVILPSFPALSDHFATPSSEIALSISLFALGVAISQFFLGPLSDRIGRKGLLVLGLAISILGAVGCANTVQFIPFMLFRTLQAIGCGCFVLLNALVQDLFQDKERERTRILITSASGVFISTSPLVGALLQHLAGWQASFYLFALIALLVLIQAIRILPPTRGANRPAKGLIGAYRELLCNPAFMGFSLIAAIAFTCHFAFIAISPLIFLDHFQLTQLQFGLTLLSYGAAYVLGGLIASRMSRSVSHRLQLNTGLTLIGLAGVTMLAVAALTERSVASVLLGMMICTAGTTIARPAATSRAMELVPASAGAAASVLNTLVLAAGDFEWVLGMVFLVLCLAGLITVTRLYAKP